MYQLERLSETNKMRSQCISSTELLLYSELYMSFHSVRDICM